MTKTVKTIFAILVFLLPLFVLAQEIVIKGKLTDETGMGIPDVSVTLKGTAVVTKTDASGSFSIAVPGNLKNAQLTFTHVSYMEQTINVSGTEVSLTMQKSTTQLDDVVVIGYGTQKKRNVAGAVSKLKNENFQERAITRVDQALVGQLAGVRVKQNTGIPGKAFSIQIRGSGSISGGNEPLYVLDGFPLSVNSSNTGNGTFTTGNPLDNINPNDIESIEVLKDAAAAAIYGSRD